MGRESMIGGDQDVCAIEQAAGAERVLDSADLRIDQCQCFAHEIRTDSMCMARRIGISEPHKRHIGLQLLQPQAQVCVYRIAVACGIRGGGWWRRSDLLSDSGRQFGRAYELGIDDCAYPTYGVEQKR